MGAQDMRIKNLIERYGGIDGAHHKQWVLDQIMRIVLGMPAYRQWCRERARAGYTWDEGIAP